MKREECNDDRIYSVANSLTLMCKFSKVENIVLSREVCAVFVFWRRLLPFPTAPKSCILLKPGPLELHFSQPSNVAETAVHA